MSEPFIGVIQDYITEVQERFTDRDDVGARTANALCEELREIVSNYCMGRLTKGKGEGNDCTLADCTA